MRNQGIVKCHLAVDTGFNRFGNKVKEIEILKKIYEFKNLNILGIFSHLSRTSEFTEEADNYTKMQINNFNTIIEKLEKTGINVGIKHLMNSIGLLRFNDKRYDMVRSGLLMYGISTDVLNKNIEEIEKNFKLIISLKCKVMTVKTLEEGEKVGYGGIYTAKERIKIATISIGYADGFPSPTSKNELNVVIKGILCPIVGKVCMDITMVKLPLDCDIKEGDIVTIFGCDKKGHLVNFKEFFSKSGLYVEETISRLGQRITRIYHL